MSTQLQPRVRGGKTAGRYESFTHGAPALTLGASSFPHPDVTAAHPMDRWPREVETPTSIEVGRAGDGPEAQPQVTLTMGNGAALVLQARPRDEFPESEALFDGDWDSYTAGDRHLMDDVLNTASETLMQCTR